MQLAILSQESDFREYDIAEKIIDTNLIYYASEVAGQMNFADVDELQEAVTKAYNICITAGIPVKGNFKRIYLSTINGILCDWKLSVLAYNLVCLNGNGCNPNVAKMQIRLLKNS